MIKNAWTIAFVRPVCCKMGLFISDFLFMCFAPHALKRLPTLNVDKKVSTATLYVLLISCLMLHIQHYTLFGMPI